MAGGCSYLDVDPELGLTQDEVFETYKNYRSYFDWVYESNGGKNMERIHISFPFYYDLFQSRTFSWYQATDAVDCGLLGVSQLNFKQGILSQELIEQLTFDVSKADYKPIVKAMFSIIRRCNIAIQNIDLCKNATEEERNDLLGQAYFLRAYAHFTLSRQFGGMPYIDHTLEAGDVYRTTKPLHGSPRIFIRLTNISKPPVFCAGTPQRILPARSYSNRQAQLPSDYGPAPCSMPPVHSATKMVSKTGKPRRPQQPKRWR